ncbi:uncharacterized protein [Pithys albifrons albifrons]|uniref:uncharacterized protein n=1 Tax=Pithys albifrons albifrons TaxID=3385563 RepID=UPI003A5D1629
MTRDRGGRGGPSSRAGPGGAPRGGLRRSTPGGRARRPPRMCPRPRPHTCDPALTPMAPPAHRWPRTGVPAPHTAGSAPTSVTPSRPHTVSPPPHRWPAPVTPPPHRWLRLRISGSAPASVTPPRTPLAPPPHRSPASASVTSRPLRWPRPTPLAPHGWPRPAGPAPRYRSLAGIGTDARSSCSVTPRSSGLGPGSTGGIRWLPHEVNLAHLR